ncbi:hypothetical protein AU210_005687 [Fusarium oxysporum f. sp. radicis-cucumerinum]|nr:hypothetical protein AU210_005687 [Fusarium oxysporum f. sp. radicis-cucumerinum]RKK22382.1 hypothetical protein BFJ65_g4985 [Fusarium oxysporum f. sp. cepae]RKK35603.1 hypothetical protein BFJ66_g13896 [Fusarium oxysporum f. sp. cepae]RKK47695.1 hypothetical protein BFJ67_g7683 [Fusarium oxysporum f. sp. cepae]RKK86604.1 hypothetical protein BFJ71_g13697 [Fusarium oxysporum]
MPSTTIKSFHSLSVENPDFAIHPRLWTANHLSMVNCNFQRIETDDAHGFGSLDTHTAERLAVLAKKLSVGVVPGSKFFWVENLLLRKGTSPIAFSKYFKTYSNAPAPAGLTFLGHPSLSTMANAESASKIRMSTSSAFKTRFRSLTPIP